MVEALRVLNACRKTAVAARRIALQMIHNTIVCAPNGLRETLRRLDLDAPRPNPGGVAARSERLPRRRGCLPDRPEVPGTALAGTARRDADLDTMIGAIVDEFAPDVVARNSIGRKGAAKLLLTAGDNPEWSRSEASFAALCGVSPLSASSGKTVRHRLNRGGDRAANSVLHIIAIGRLRTDARTKAYMARRIAEGHSKLEAIRCLRRYIAREVFTLITRKQKAIRQTRIAARHIEGRPRLAIHERSRPAADGRIRRDVLDELVGQRLGQRAAMERFFSSLKTARTARRTYRTRDEASADVFDYLERFYNLAPRHSTLGYLSPVEFENRAQFA